MIRRDMFFPHFLSGLALFAYPLDLAAADEPAQPEPDHLPYVAGETPPAGYVLEERSRSGVTRAGGAIFGVASVWSIAIAIGSKDARHAIPFVGTLLVTTDDDSCEADVFGDCLGEGLARSTIAVAFGVFMVSLPQLVGTIVAMVGLSLPKKKIWVKDTELTLSVEPVEPTGRPGLGLTLRF